MNRDDRKIWSQTRTLADVGELVAQWLEGTLSSVPGYCGAPAEETESLMPVLAAINRAGFVTDTSQPGGSGEGWEQRAAVQGYADDATLERLREACMGHPEIYAIAQKAPRWFIRFSTATPVTRSRGRDVTQFGARLSKGHLSDAWVGYGECGDEAVDAICDAWQVTLVDTEWGREDSPLWAVLADFASRMPSGGAGIDRTPAPGGHPVRAAIGAGAEVTACAALALLLAGALYRWAGTAWYVRVLVAWVVFVVAGYPVMDDLVSALLRTSDWLDGHLGRSAPDA